jgi:hypothetical protein
MLTIALALSLVPLFIILGGGIGTLLFNMLPLEKQKSKITLYSLSLISFLFLVSFSTVWSFGFIGSDYFILILVTCIILSFLTCFKKIKLSFIKQIWFKATKLEILSIFLLGVLSLILCSNFMENFQHVKLATGIGPDISQNLMAIVSQREHGRTYTGIKNYFYQTVGSNDYFDSYKQLLTLPSMREVALVDYLIFGTRWGLTIPLAQILRLNPNLIISFQAITLAVSLFMSAIILIGLLKIIQQSNRLASYLAISTISSSCVLFLFFNGGMAQIFALAGQLGMIYCFLILLKEYPVRNISIYITFAMSCFIVLVTYAEAFIILVLWMLIFFLMKLRKLNRNFIDYLRSISLVSFTAVLLLVPYLFAFIPSIQIRLKGSLGTGYNFNPFPFPSELLGVINIWTSQYIEYDRNLVHLFTSQLLSIGIGFLFFVNYRILKFNNINLLFISFLVLITYVFGNSIYADARTNYAYVKTFSYFIPFLFYYIYCSFVRKSVQFFMNQYLSILLVVSIFASTFNFLANIHKSEVAMLSHRITEVIEDKDALEELEKYNYLTVYRPIANMIGVISDFHWIARAPNGLDLTGRLDNEVRIICLQGDSECRTKMSKVNSSELSKYGFDIYEATISTAEFNELNPQQRYDKVYELIGQTPLDLPRSFIGGNPILDN